jgi:hypothetical protein
LKKYPFSKKALYAVLAATVALSPLVTTSPAFQPEKVEAATVSQEIDTLAERFFVFYKHVDSYGFTGTPTAAISSLSFAQIQSTATANGITLNVPVAKQADFENMMKNTATLIYTKYDTSAALSTALKSFKTANTSHFNSLFDENGDVFADQLILFVKDLESQFELAIMDATAPTFSAVISAAVKNTFEKGANKAQYANLDGMLGKVGLTTVNLFLLQEKLNDSIVDPNKNLRSALMQSAFQAKGAYIERNVSNNEFTLNVPVKFINDTVLVPIKGSINWQTSNPTIATFNRNVLTPVANGTVNVYATLDGIKLATFNGVSVTVPVEPPVTPPPVTPPPVTPPVDPPKDSNPHLPSGTTEVKKETSPTGQVQVVTKVSSEKVADLANTITATNKTVAVNLEKPAAGEKVQAQLPSSLFTEVGKKNANAVVEVKTAEASYKLPASQINVNDLAKKLGVSAANVQIIVSVNVVEKAQIQNGIKVISKVVEFSVEAVSGENREKISNFSEYVARTIVGDQDVDSNKSTCVRLNADGSVTPVPTMIEGKEVTCNSITNSMYTVVENNITFRDVDNQNNWAKKYIETLANKYLIKGKTDGNFAPGEEMTRAQFTVLLVKALGLPGEEYEQKFTDVKSTDWFNANGELAAAVKYGVITGKPDGRFAPNEKISRTQAAVMLHRVMQLDFIKYDAGKLDKTKRVTDFKDIARIADWSKTSIEAVYQAGIISGKPDSTFDPNGKTKRDQMAKMLAEFLISAKLMNEIK